MWSRGKRLGANVFESADTIPCLQCARNARDLHCEGAGKPLPKGVVPRLNTSTVDVPDLRYSNEYRRKLPLSYSTSLAYRSEVANPIVLAFVIKMGSTSLSQQQSIHTKDIYHGLPDLSYAPTGMTAIVTGSNGISGSHMVSSAPICTSSHPTLTDVTRLES